LFDRMSGALEGSTNPYARKDLRKAQGASKFIGRGSPASSTNRYRLAAGSMANAGHYTDADTVFVSAEGARRGRIVADIAELWKAAEAGVVFVTDGDYDRSRPYNIGEREVAAVLRTWGFQDNGSGRWRRK
jgi:hypothetical protein